jgi:hypothetical protein
MDAGGKVGTRFPKVDGGGDRKEEDRMGAESLGGDFPNYAQATREDCERKRGGMWGDRPKPRGQRLMSRWGFLQGCVGARK